ncbi:hypothetical protein KI387_019352, partial [Taxus chinensis]
SFPSETQTMLNESTIEININTQDDPHILKIGQSLDATKHEAFTSFLWDHSNAFSWSYVDMPGIDPNIVVHNIVTIPESKP